jgi:cell division protein FtsQ
VQITQLDWHDPNNLILHTEIGLVHCGPYNKQFEQQLVAIDHLRNLNQYPEAQGIEYLDLSRPDSPYLKMLKPHVAPTPVAPERQ